MSINVKYDQLSYNYIGNGSTLVTVLKEKVISIK